MFMEMVKLYNSNITQTIIVVGKIATTLLLIYCAVTLILNIEEFKATQNPCDYAKNHNFTCCDTYQVINQYGISLGTYNISRTIESLNLSG